MPASSRSLPASSRDAAARLWEAKYRAPGEARIEDTWARVARAVAAVERDAPRWAARFESILSDFRFLPGGRILAGAGLERRVTLFNCFVMGTIEDSLDGIFQALKEGALTMQQGGGVGYDFSTLRPRGTHAGSSGTIPSGPVSFLEVWDAMAKTVLSTGLRRGAMMATLRCDHPDIEEFVAAKATPGALARFNLSVLVTDALIEAVRRDAPFPLVFPPPPASPRVRREVRARDLWSAIAHGAWERGDPGVLFVDRINRLNNLWYAETIAATNPCGEIPLPPYGSCNLGSIDLTRFVLDPFGPGAHLDEDAIVDVATVATRFLDDVIDASRFPLEAQARCARATRRVGLGVTGLADALVMLGLRYDERAARDAAARVMRAICHAAYRASVELAREKESFPSLDRERLLAGPFAAKLPDDVRNGIARFGLRNSHLVAIAPTGSISVLAGGVSTGIEPVYAATVRRPWSGPGGELVFDDYAVAVHRTLERHDAGLPAAFVTAEAIAPESHIAMQAALQPFVDNAIAKTVNVPRELPFDRFEPLFFLAYELGLKGCTAFRPNPVTGALLEAGPACAACESPAPVAPS
jgi:ribonucleoside-diphosphate reductase alpha chain